MKTKPYTIGDRSKGICEECRCMVETIFERRDFPLKEGFIKNCLVACCINCGNIVAVAGIQ